MSPAFAFFKKKKIGSGQIQIPSRHLSDDVSNDGKHYHTAVSFLLLVSLLNSPREGVCPLKALCCHTPWHPSCGAPHNLANQTHQCPNRAQVLLKMSVGATLSLAR